MITKNYCFNYFQLAASDEYKYEATYIIYKIFQKQKLNHIQLKQLSLPGAPDQSQLTSLFNMDLIRHTLETSKNFPVWHIRLLFLISVSSLIFIKIYFMLKFSKQSFLFFSLFNN